MKSKFLLILFVAVASFTACIKNDRVLWEGTVAEIDANTWNANAAGLTYAILTRKPADGRPSGTSDSTLRRWPQTIRLRINLVGAQSAQARTVGYEIFNSPITTVSMPATITGQTPSAAAATLNVINAVPGTHYTALSGTVTIPANSSFGYIDIQILRPAATAGTAAFIGIRLTDAGDIKPSQNYKEIGLVIDQR